MFKLKSKAWILKVKELYADDKKTLDELIDRTEMVLTDMKSYRQRRFCPNCFRSGSLSPVCKCGAETLDMEFEAQIPHKRASKSRWRKFFQKWYPELNFAAHWNNR